MRTFMVVGAYRGIEHLLTTCSHAGSLWFGNLLNYRGVMITKTILMGGAMLMLVAGEAVAQKRVNNTRGSTKNLEMPKCNKTFGTVSLVNGEGRGWHYYKLGEPSTLIKVFIQRSGCFKLVDRGAGLSALQREMALSQGGGLQRGSNVGAGQIKAADYVIVVDIVGANANAGGGGLGGIAGGLIGGRVGGIVGGFRSKKIEAQTVLTVMSTRTTEVEATAEGFASKNDISFGGGAGRRGFGNFGGVVGGGYENTDVGKVVTYAFLDAYQQIVGQLGWLPDSAAQAAPLEAFIVRKDVIMHRSPSQSGSVVRELERGMLVYPLGGKEGLWWEIEDENGNVGWVENDKLKPAR